MSEVPNRIAARDRIVQEIGDLHRLLVDRVADYAIFALNPEGYILSWNTGAERLKGYRPAEAIGQHFSIFYPPDDIASGKPDREIEEAIATGRVEDEGWRLRKDGTRFWASVSITALRDDTGALLGFAKITRDLTERRAAEDAARMSDLRFRLLIESVKDYAIFMLDPAGRITMWNEGARSIKGYEASEIVGRHFSIFYPPEDIATNKPGRELRIAADTGRYEEEGWRVRKDGSRFWANVTIAPIRGPDGMLLGFAKVTRDLTERRAAQERTIADARRIAAQEAEHATTQRRSGELRGLAEQLRVQTLALERRSLEAERANRAKAEFLAAMSHELRTPLNAIGGYTQLMQLRVSGPLTADQEQHLERIRLSQEHLLGIINDILNFSRIEAGQVAYSIAPVEVQQVLGAVVPMITPQAAARRISLIIEKGPPELVASADRAKVEQILLNLLSNSVKFTEEGGTVTVACGTSEGTAWISVRDTGIGIPADQMEVIFAPFVQVGRSLANPKEGTGLGLAISRDLARAMHGDLTVESKEGAGSTFTVTLPAASLGGT